MSSCVYLCMYVFIFHFFRKLEQPKATTYVPVFSFEYGDKYDKYDRPILGYHNELQ